MTYSVLVTGASGFLGRRLVESLRAQGEMVATHSSGDGDLVLEGPSIDTVEHVYHLAAKTFVPASWASPVDFYAVNVLGTIRVLDYCRRCNASFTLVSSYLYGTALHMPVREEHPLKAVNPYAHSKLLAEEVAQFYATTFGVPITIARPFNLYGPGQSPDFLIPSLIRQACSRDHDCISVADLRPKRDYLYVDDAVEFLILLRRLGARGVYNLGSGVSTSVQELANMIREIIDCRKPILSRNQIRQNEVLDSVADITKAKTELGWVPRTSLRAGLVETAKHYLTTE